jgi:hypothetical protein
MASYRSFELLPLELIWLPRPTWTARALTLYWALFQLWACVAGSVNLVVRYFRSVLLCVFHHLLFFSFAWNLAADQLPPTA